jgi:menaquinone-specific isochorismate synthase
LLINQAIETQKNKQTYFAEILEKTENSFDSISTLIDFAPFIEVTNPTLHLQTCVEEAYKQYHAKRDATAVVPSYIHRISVPIDSIDLFAWLSAQSDEIKIYWSAREDVARIAALGSAVSIQAAAHTGAEVQLAEAQALVQTEAQARFFGGIRFDNKQHPAEEWDAFGKFYFVLPRFEVHQIDATSILYCNLVFPQDQNSLEEIRQQIAQLTFPDAPLVGDFSPIYEQIYEPKVREWHQKIVWLLEQFNKEGLQKGDLQKVVLARKALFKFAKTFDPVYLFKQLVEVKPDCFHFYFQPSLHHAFLSATPERLYHREGHTIFSEAVAGTRPAGGENDDQMAAELAASEKDQREHEYVRQSIGEVLAPLCTDLHTDEHTTIMRLTRRMHLWSRISGTLRPDVNDMDLIRTLHPTPAVGGHPTPNAISAIAALEPFDRGWYAGPIGWIGANASEFAVGIRSGLVHENTLSLYSGAGIVAGSTPDGEWKEIEQKISDFLDVLGLDS